MLFSRVIFGSLKWPNQVHYGNYLNTLLLTYMQTQNHQNTHHEPSILCHSMNSYVTDTLSKFYFTNKLAPAEAFGIWWRCLFPSVLLMNQSKLIYSKSCILLSLNPLNLPAPYANDFLWHNLRIWRFWLKTVGIIDKWILECCQGNGVIIWLLWVTVIKEGGGNYGIQVIG